MFNFWFLKNSRKFIKKRSIKIEQILIILMKQISLKNNPKNISWLYLNSIYYKILGKGDYLRCLELEYASLLY
jgi:hypothetical protein